MGDINCTAAGHNYFVIEGDLDARSAPDLLTLLEQLAIDRQQTVTIDLNALDIEDGVAVATAISALRDLRARVAGLVLRAAPQLLGHNLYRVGALDGIKRIELIDLRNDEPYG